MTSIRRVDFAITHLQIRFDSIEWKIFANVGDKHFSFVPDVSQNGFARTTECITKHIKNMNIDKRNMNNLNTSPWKILFSSTSSHISMTFAMQMSVPSSFGTKTKSLTHTWNRNQSHPHDDVSFVYLCFSNRHMVVLETFRTRIRWVLPFHVLPIRT